MQDLMWFLLGASVYGLSSLLLEVSRKARFIDDIKILAFQLIGQAFEELLKIHIMKYSILNNSPTEISKEQLKILKNEDEAFLNKWKKNTVETLNHAVPPIYYSSVGLKDWEEIPKTLITLHDNYMKTLEDIDEQAKH